MESNKKNLKKSRYIIAISFLLVIIFITIAIIKTNSDKVISKDQTALILKYSKDPL